MKATLALLSLNILNALDGALTLRAVAYGAVELNPFVAPLLGSVAVFMALKVGIVGVGSSIVYWYEVEWALYAGVVLFGLVVLWNFAGVASSLS